MRSLVRFAALAFAVGLVASCSRTDGDPGAPGQGEDSSTRPATVRVDGRHIVVNGQEEVPRGLFGVHAVGITPELRQDMGVECYRGIHFGPGSGSVAIGKDGKVKPQYQGMPVVIDCQGDRYATATCLSNPDYEAFFRKIGHDYAQRCKDAGWHGIVEFWNEPYLNWAERSHGSGRNNYHENFYDISKAVDGGPATIKGWDKPLKHLKWKRLWARGEDGKIYWGVQIPPGAKPGHTFKSHSPDDWYWTDRREQTFTVIEEWHLHDPTQARWWSGRQNLDFYLWMFLPFAEAVKETNPDVRIIAGWDFGFSHGNWAVWRDLLVPVIDAAVQHIDGLTDHHYGLDSRWVPVWYEVAAAYAVTKHGKWLRGYNTECGGKLDPAVHGAAADEGAGDALRQEAAAATYALRDILELAHHAPAKVGSRTAHHAQPNTGAAAALRLLKDLRGPMLCAHADDLDVWPVASLNADRLVLAVFNNAAGPRGLALALDAPAGTTFGPGQWAWLEADPRAAAKGDRPLRIATEPAKAAGRRAELARTLGSHQAVTLVLPLRGTPPARAQLERRQFFAAEGVLLPVAPGGTLRLHVDVDPRLLARAEKAYLKLCLEGKGLADAGLTLNGKPVAVPDRQFTTVLPLDKADVAAANELVFTLPPGAAEGFQVNVASILLDAPLEP